MRCFRSALASRTWCSRSGSLLLLTQALLLLHLLQGQLSAAEAKNESPYLGDFREVPLSPENAANLRRALETPGGLTQVPKIFFDQAYDPSLPAVIIHVSRRNGGVDSSIAVVQGGVSKKWLHGQRYIWVLVFVTDHALAGRLIRPPADLKTIKVAVTLEPGPEGALVPKLTSIETSQPPKTILEVRFEPLDYRPPLSESAAIKAILGIVGKLPTPGEAPALKDVTSPMEAFAIDSSDRQIAYANFKVSLAENTVNRVRVKFGGELNAYATFANYSGSWIGASVALVGSVPAKKAARLEQFRLAPYGLFHVHLRRPHRPSMGEITGGGSFGLYTGLRLGNEAFRDLVGGVSFGHLWSNVGMITGVNVLRDEERGNWSTRWLVGVQYSL